MSTIVVVAQIFQQRFLKNLVRIGGIARHAPGESKNARAKFVAQRSEGLLIAAELLGQAGEEFGERRSGGIRPSATSRCPPKLDSTASTRKPLPLMEDK